MASPDLRISANELETLRLYIEMEAMRFQDKVQYAIFHLADGQPYLVTRSMRDIQDLLEERDFLRVHRQYLINLNQIKKFVKGEGNYVVMTNGQSIPVSRAQKDRLLERFGWL